MPYEKRLEEINKGGLKISYSKLKFTYKKLGVTRDQYKEPEDSKTGSDHFYKQVEQLMALELANIKMRG